MTNTKLALLALCAALALVLGPTGSAYAGGDCCKEKAAAAAAAEKKDECKGGGCADAAKKDECCQAEGKKEACAEGAKKEACADAAKKEGCDAAKKDACADAAKKEGCDTAGGCGTEAVNAKKDGGECCEKRLAATWVVKLDGMCCDGCAGKIETALKTLEGVAAVKVHADKKIAVVRMAEGKAMTQEIAAKVLEGTKYKVAAFHTAKDWMAAQPKPACHEAKKEACGEAAAPAAPAAPTKP